MSRGPRFVLDTHTALWAQLDVKRLGRNARTALAGLPPSALAVCDVTLTEVARLLRDARRDFVSLAREYGLTPAAETRFPPEATEHVEEDAEEAALRAFCG